MGYNMFAYCNDNPVRLKDPTGNCPLSSDEIKYHIANECDPKAWDHAMYLAECVVRGDYNGLNAPDGITKNHLYFNKASTFQTNIYTNDGKFHFGGNTEPVPPLEAVQYGGNTFFYY